MHNLFKSILPLLFLLQFGNASAEDRSHRSNPVKSQRNAEQNQLMESCLDTSNSTCNDAADGKENCCIRYVESETAASHDEDQFNWSEPEKGR